MADTDSLYTPLAQSSEKILSRALRDGFEPPTASPPSSSAPVHAKLRSDIESATPFTGILSSSTGSEVAGSETLTLNARGPELLRRLRVSPFLSFPSLSFFCCI
jgi:hypothetical protein